MMRDIRLALGIFLDRDCRSVFDPQFSRPWPNFGAHSKPENHDLLFKFPDCS